MKRNKVFLAFDTSNIDIVKKYIKQLQHKEIKIIPKFGLQFFYSKKGREYLKNIKQEFWLDVKINDVPQTAISAMKSLNDLNNLKYISVHANGGLKMMKLLRKNTRKNINIFGVTVLTSLNNKDIREIGYSRNINEIVVKQADLIKKAGLNGIICSAKESKIIRKKYKKLFIVTPGVRLPGDSFDDQSRVVTPKEAYLKYNVDAVVMGRSLTRGNIKSNIKKLINHLKNNGY